MLIVLSKPNPQTFLQKKEIRITSLGSVVVEVRVSQGQLSHLQVVFLQKLSSDFWVTRSMDFATIP